jgi:hypothetical protein
VLSLQRQARDWASERGCGMSIHITQVRDHNQMADVYTVVVLDKDLFQLKLDPLERAVLEQEAKVPSDTLQNLQILAFRIEQQKGLG